MAIFEHPFDKYARQGNGLSNSLGAKPYGVHDVGAEVKQLRHNLDLLMDYLNVRIESGDRIVPKDAP